MRYIINASLIYDASNGSLSLPGGHEAETQLSVTANALLQFFCSIMMSLAAKRC